MNTDQQTQDNNTRNKRPHSGESNNDENIDSPSTPLEHKRQKSDNRDAYSDVKEFDGVFVHGDDLSVGTIIKRAAVVIHDTKFVKELDVSHSERNRMTNGLSSLLVLINKADGCQKGLFTDAQWSSLCDRYINKYKLPRVPVPEEADDIWKIICGSSKDANNINLGLEYIRKIYSNDLYEKYLDFLKIYDHVLNCIVSKSDYLCRDPPHEITEYDHMSVLWSPLLELLFRDTSIRIKIDRSAYEHKLDIRFIVDCNCDEYEIAIGEATRSNDASEELVPEEGKLLRNGKDVLDKMVRSNKIEPAHSWTLQIEGSGCFASTVQLDSNGLYVVVPQFTFRLPRNLDDLPQFIESLSSLLTMKHELEISAKSITK